MLSYLNSSWYICQNYIMICHRKLFVMISQLTSQLSPPNFVKRKEFGTIWQNKSGHYLFTLLFLGNIPLKICFTKLFWWLLDILVTLFIQMIPLSRSWGNQNTISFSTSFLVYFWHMFLFCDMLLNNSFVRTLWLPISSFKQWDMTTMKTNWQSQFSLPKQLAKLDLFSYIKKKSSDLFFNSHKLLRTHAHDGASVPEQSRAQTDPIS